MGPLSIQACGWEHRALLKVEKGPSAQGLGTTAAHTRGSGSPL